MFNSISRFLDILIDYGLEYFGRFYGIYLGKVIKTADPGGQGRIIVQVPAVMGKDPIGTPAMPTAIYAGNDHGVYFPPEEGETVLVWFENGDPRFPWYIGGFWSNSDVTSQDQNTSELPEEFKATEPPATDWSSDPPMVRGIKVLNIAKDKSFLLLFNKKSGEESIRLVHPELSELKMDQDGSVEIKDNNENKIFLDTPNKEIVITNNADNVNTITMKGDSIEISHTGGSTVRMEGGNITIESNDNINITCNSNIDVTCSNATVNADRIELGEGASEKAILGDSWNTYFSQQFINSGYNVHTHNCPVGPTTPPLVPAQPPTPSVYSSRVFVKG